jgi:hypothetical protein
LTRAHTHIPQLVNDSNSQLIMREFNAYIKEASRDAVLIGATIQADFLFTFSNVTSPNFLKRDTSFAQAFTWQNILRH